MTFYTVPVHVNLSVCRSVGVNLQRFGEKDLAVRQLCMVEGYRHRMKTFDIQNKYTLGDNSIVFSDLMMCIGDTGSKLSFTGSGLRCW